MTDVNDVQNTMNTMNPMNPMNPMNTTTRLVIVRHGNTFNRGDVILRVGARTDLPLTEEGLGQGDRAGAAMAGIYEPPAAIFTAPLLRTTQMTEQIVSSAGWNHLTPVVEPMLTELDYGRYDGQPESEVAAELGEEALKLWDKESILPPQWSHLTQYIVDIHAFWTRFATDALNCRAGQTTVAVTSNGIARFSSSILLPEEPLPADGMKLSTGAFGVYEHDGRRWHCVKWNVRG